MQGLASTHLGLSSSALHKMTKPTQLYECSRQCSRPVLARCSMGFGPNPLINGLILHILFLEKITVIHFD